VTTAAEILAFLGAGPDPAGSQELSAVIDGPGTIDAAGAAQVAFCSAAARGALERARATRAGITIADEALAGDLRAGGLVAGVLVVSERPRLDFARVVAHFFADAPPAPGVHPSAVVAAGAKVHETATIGPLCSIAERVEIGPGSVLHAGVHLYRGVRLGARVTVHSGTVIGATGFGYERDEQGGLQPIPHVGGVLIEDDVEIGANTAIDRGSIEDTVICRGARIDNLVHIAHNVTVGAGAAVIAHAMIGGSVRLGERAWIAPAACLRDGIEVGEDAVIGLGAVVTRDVPAAATVLGNPAREREESARLNAALRRLAVAPD
jgi:UDP-3-O-[3-hydroxymyristoyl] glucosamine N-acyltransferase